MRTFTLPEAHTLLPILDALLRRAQAAAAVVTSREQMLQGLSQAIYLSGGMRVDLPEVARIKAEQTAATGEAKDALDEIAAIGVEVHDFAGGQLEFPFLLDGEIVMLCWLQGQEHIQEWHAAEAGWDERQPLDERFTRGERPQ